MHVTDTTKNIYISIVSIFW